MRILMLAPQPFYEGRGTPIAVRAAAEGLAQLGHAVDLLTYFGGEDVALPPGVTHTRCPRPGIVKQVPIGVSWQKLPCDWVLYRHAAAMLEARRYDLIHGVEEAGFLARRLARRFTVPYVFDMDSLMSSQIIEKNPLFAPVAWVFGWLERRAIRDSAGVLAVCPMLVDYARRHHPAGRVALLPDQPVPPSGDAQAPPELLQLTGVKLVYVGNLERYQGIDLLLDAFALVAGELPQATVVIIGGREDHIAHYRAKAGALAASGRVIFLGPRPLAQLPAILREADVLLSPRSKGINTPMKIYNYMDAGKAILATRMTTHTQVLDDATACLVDPTPAAFAEGLRRVASEPQYRARIAAAAKARLDAEYSIPRWHQRLADFITSLPTVS